MLTSRAMLNALNARSTNDLLEYEIVQEAIGTLMARLAAEVPTESTRVDLVRLQEVRTQLDPSVPQTTRVARRLLETQFGRV